MKKWNIYFILATFITVLLCIMQKSSLLLSISSITGVIYSLLIARNTKYAFIFGIINVATLGYILYIQNIYGGFLYNILYSLPMLIWGYVKWGKISNTKNSGIKKLKKKTKIIGVIILTVIIFIASYILYKLGSNNYILDASASILGYAGIYLMTNKYIEQWDVFVICNLANLGMWASITYYDMTNIPVFVMWLIYTLNSLYGYISWYRKYK